ncbi:hypothetical protein NW762_008909 [Fusarium torreyae]|uniref:EthD domain-containing protein n=1 Tax=Fusarium torreyae TaxID=1237075 RepID=A0A9W8RYC5_9HYPO|nr:hypothetical protein NW762_008909 [Fusarium torreyae]
MFYYCILAYLLTLRNAVTLASITDEAVLIEPLFLDVTIYDVIHDTEGIPTIEPWASDYVAAIRDNRFGDAIWARYHMMGGVTNHILDGTNITVLASIKEDAIDYKVNTPEDFAKALDLYAGTSENDAHTDVLDTISRLQRAPIKNVTVI